MGIHSLNRLLQNTCGLAWSENPIQRYAHNRIAIDTALMLHQIKYRISQQHQSSASSASAAADSALDPPPPCMDPGGSGVPLSRLLFDILSKVNQFLSWSILPVFVFDGTPPRAKWLTLAQRSMNRQRIQQRIIEARNRCAPPSTIEHMAKQIITVGAAEYSAVYDFLDHLGVPVVQSDGEAEGLCSHLSRLGLVDYVLSDDTDCFPFGATKILRTRKRAMPLSSSMSLPLPPGAGNFPPFDRCQSTFHHFQNQQQQQRNASCPRFLEIDTAKVHEMLGLSHSEFIDLCILLGCDYNSCRVPPATALDLIQTHRTIEACFAANDLRLTSIVADIGDVNAIEARRLFGRFAGPPPPPPPSPSLSTFELGEFREDEVRTDLASANVHPVVIRACCATFRRQAATFRQSFSPKAGSIAQ